MAIERHDLGPRVRAVLDEAVARPVVACCFPGGGMTAGYFDLPAPYSMAEDLARRGVVVLLVDHPTEAAGT